MNISKETLNKRIEDVIPWVIQMRRQFHQCPELGDSEQTTTDLIIKALEKMEIQIERILPTGVVGIICGEMKPSANTVKKTVAIRADIDALPMEENTGLSFASQNKGCMHACGHDAHTAILLGTAKVLKTFTSAFSGTIKLFFQPAEETDGGAQRMMEMGCMENPAVDYVIGLHVMPQFPSGILAFHPGKMNAASDMFDVIIKGSPTHGAYPEKGVDPIVTASQFIVNTQFIISRNLSPLNQALISFGSIHGGSARNIIPGQVDLSGMIRTTDQQTRTMVKERFEEVALYTGKANRCDIQLHFIPGYPALINDNGLTGFLIDTAKEEFGIEHVKILDQPSMGVEDFAFFAQKSTSAFFSLGCGFEEKENPPLHSDLFILNEECLKLGVQMEVYSTIKLLHQQIQKIKE